MFFVGLKYRRELEIQNSTRRCREYFNPARVARGDSVQPAAAKFDLSKLSANINDSIDTIAITNLQLTI